MERLVCARALGRHFSTFGCDLSQTERGVITDCAPDLVEEVVENTINVPSKGSGKGKRSNSREIVRMSDDGGVLSVGTHFGTRPVDIHRIYSNSTRLRC